MDYKLSKSMINYRISGSTEGRHGPELRYLGKKGQLLEVVDKIAYRGHEEKMWMEEAKAFVMGGRAQNGETPGKYLARLTT